MVHRLRALTTVNGRFARQLAKTMLAAPRDDIDTSAFHAFCEARQFEFTQAWTDSNINVAAPLLRNFAQGREKIRYLEIGSYEGRSLAFMNWLLPGQLDVTVIDPWYHAEMNAQPVYLEVEPRFRRNAERLSFERLDIHKGLSTYELPKMLQAGQRYDLIYIDGSHTAWAVGVDIAFCAAMLEVGGMIVLDDYWHMESEIGGPGVKQAVDRFYGVFRQYFEISAVYRQVALTKIAEIPR